MDAQTLASTAGVAVGTLNMWLQRGIVPGKKVGKGRRREFDVETAIDVGIIAELVRLFGVRPGAASMIAQGRARHKRLLLLSSFEKPAGMVIRDQASFSELQQNVRQAPVLFGFESEADLPKLFEKIRVIPTVYTIINVEHIAARMREAYERWEQKGAG